MTPDVEPTASSIQQDVAVLAGEWRTGAAAVAARVAELDLALVPAIAFLPSSGATATGAGE